MGYYVSALDKDANTISLSLSSSMLSTFFIGQVSQVTLTVTVVDGGNKLNIDISCYGNFGSGEQEGAMSIVKDFKTKLFEKLNNIKK